MIVLLSPKFEGRDIMAGIRPVDEKEAPQESKKMLDIIKKLVIFNNITLKNIKRFL